MLHFFLYSAMKKATCHIIAQLIQIVEEGEEEVVEEVVEDLPESSAFWQFQTQDEDDDIEIEYTGTPV